MFPGYDGALTVCVASEQIMSVQNKGLFTTAYHLACGLGVVCVVCGFLNLWSCLVVGVIGAVVLIVFLFGAAALQGLLQATTERMAANRRRAER